MNTTVNMRIDREAFDNYMHQAEAIMRQEISWEKMREPMIDIYLKHYTEEELQQMLIFYQSEVGQSMLSKMPAVVQDSVILSQSMLENLMPKIQKLSDELYGSSSGESKKLDASHAGHNH